jgi:hypothetical protein
MAFALPIPVKRIDRADGLLRPRCRRHYTPLDDNLGCVRCYVNSNPPHEERLNKNISILT